jgi:tRNA-2-methylthio-N6-dimethylallyladenosine synthase
MVSTVVTRAAPHYLIADGEPVAVRPTRGGDAWAARRASARGEGSPASPPGGGSRGGVLLGMPALSRPA